MYDLQVVARLGGQYGITNIPGAPSINDNGVVAFVAESPIEGGQAADNIYAYDPLFGRLNQLMNPAYMYAKEGADTGLNAGTQSIWPRLQINNADEILARRRLNVEVFFGGLQQMTAPLSYLESWGAFQSQSLPRHQVAMGLPGANSASLLWWITNPPNFFAHGLFPVSLNLDSPYEGILPASPTLNNVGQVGFSAIVEGQGNNRISSDLNGSLIGRGPIGDLKITPMLADNGVSVLTTNDGRIFAEEWPVSNLRLLAGPTVGFTSLGEAGISDDGQVIAFAGVLTEQGAQAINTSQATLGLRLTPITPGPGIYISSPVAPGAASSVRYIQKVAGVSGNGILDPGEGFSDANGNGLFEPGGQDRDYTTRSRISALSLSSRVNVARLQGTNDYQVVYLGEGPPPPNLSETDHRLTLYSTIARLPSASTPLRVSAPDRIARVGDAVPNLGVLSELRIHDAINANGEIAFFAGAGSNQAIVKATYRPVDIKMIEVAAITPSQIRLKYRIDGRDLDEPFSIDVSYTNSGQLDAYPNFLARRAVPSRQIIYIGRDDDQGYQSNRVGEHEVTIDLDSPSYGGPRFNLQPTLETRYIYVAIDPLNEIRETIVPPYAINVDMAGVYSNDNNNVGRVGFIEPETLVAAMDRGLFRSHPRTGDSREMTLDVARTMVEPLNEALSEFFIYTIPQQAAFLAHVNHECNYSSDGLMARGWAGELWEEWYVLSPRPYQHPKISKAAFIATTKEAYFNYWYDGRAGNRPGTDDGSRFFGRGPIQLTGRTNYRDAGSALNEDLISHPELVATDKLIGFRTAAWFFAQRSSAGGVTSLEVANEILPRSTVTQLETSVTRITRIVNGYLAGLDDRILRTRQALRVLRHPNRLLHR